jgi:hypothetical protein
MYYRIMNKTEDEYQVEHIQRMGEPLGAIFNELWSDLAWLHVKWAEFFALFGTNPERVCRSPAPQTSEVSGLRISA